MSLPMDPVGSAKIKYKRKLKRDREKASSIDFPYKDDEKIKILRIPFFEIEVLEYGPRERHEGISEEWKYPDKGMGTPGIGVGGTGSTSSDTGAPLPGSGLPVSPLYSPSQIGKDGKFAGIIPVDPITGKPVEENVNIDEIATELELELLKPTKVVTEYDIEFPGIGKTGPESLLEWNETLLTNIERQLLFKKIIERKIKNLDEEKEELVREFESGKVKEANYLIEVDRIERSKANLERLFKTLPENPFRVGRIEREDKRYLVPEFTPIMYKGAVIMFIRDISGSITQDQLKTSQKLSRWIEEWVRKFYSDTKLIYILHNYDAWEVEREKYYGVVESGGGTRFASAYDIVINIFTGKDYPRETKEKKTLNPDETDVYIVQITDGFGQSYNDEIKPLKEILPKITRFCYVQEDFDSTISDFKEFLEKEFKEYGRKGALRTTSIKGYEDEYIKKAMKDLFGRKK
ncbi:MAG: DUF444 family protein [Candidatus Aenigmarchaeota archaeon]|nr:DUF444 family protein [Candidatus Aenigmarchaeota archaeon]MDW8149411.1 DUF444 family protein [Candidatus Aenigmarchaeota archaeon]